MIQNKQKYPTCHVTDKLTFLTEDSYKNERENLERGQRTWRCREKAIWWLLKIRLANSWYNENCEILRCTRSMSTFSYLWVDYAYVKAQTSRTTPIHRCLTPCKSFPWITRWSDVSTIPIFVLGHCELSYIAGLSTLLSTWSKVPSGVLFQNRKENADNLKGV